MSPDDLQEFVGHARWFGGKGREWRITALRRLGTLPGSTRELTAVVDLAEITYAGGEADHYQLPLSLRPTPADHLSHALVGVWDEEGLGTVHVYDAVHDREAMDLWLRAFDAAATSHHPAAVGGGLAFHRLGGHELDLDVHSTLFSGEQSNSSVAFGEDSLLKMFRRITPGVNPDIAVHDVLTAVGSEHVPALYGWLDMVDTASDGTGSTLQLAMLQQFLRTATDGWDLALASVRDLLVEADLHPEEVGGDFAAESARLGTALAEVHADLATHFPTETYGPAQVRDLAAAMHTRLDEALQIVPELAEHEQTLRASFDALGAVARLEVQQVHGDLHLGQTLRTVRGWKIVDFEGEPAKSLHERMLPDSRWRDVAGMLRSLDYAPRVAALTAHTAASPDEADQQSFRCNQWSARNGQAFLAGYTGRALEAEEATVLRAYVLDKAVYETVYESRHRPTWVGIPLDAIGRWDVP
jgi:maltokinase